LHLEFPASCGKKQPAMMHYVGDEGTNANRAQEDADWFSAVGKIDTDV
jgi:hypothetical protein